MELIIQDPTGVLTTIQEEDLTPESEELVMDLYKEREMTKFTIEFKEGTKFGELDIMDGFSDEENVLRIVIDLK